MKRMASRRVGMMCGFLVVSAVVMLGRFAMMVGSVGMMFCGMSMMFGCFFRHEYHLCYEFSVAEKAGPAMINDPAVRLLSLTWPTGRGWGDEVSRAISATGICRRQYPTDRQTALTTRRSRDGFIAVSSPLLSRRRDLRKFGEAVEFRSKKFDEIRELQLGAPRNSRIRDVDTNILRLRMRRFYDKA
jgi:hypothetical protein